MMTTPTTSSSAKPGPMLFLVGHGLQTPLSAIRWGCSRLKKMSKGLSKEQIHMLEGIQGQAKVLSGMVNALLLVARVEDGTYTSRHQDIYLHDFLSSFGPFKEIFPGKTMNVSCPQDLLIEGDRGVLECLFEAVSIIISTAADQQKELGIEVREEAEGRLSIHFFPELELSFMRDASSSEVEISQQMVGGAPGLMLSVASSLTRFVGGTVEVKTYGESHHLLLLELPIHPKSPSSQALAPV